MKKITLLFSIFLLMLLPANSLFAKNLFNFTSPPNEEDLNLVSDYLSKNSFYPLFEKADSEFNLIGIEDSKIDNITYIFGVISQPDRNYLAVFSIQSGWFSKKIDLVYLTNTSTLHTPQQFNKIHQMITKSLPNHSENSYLFISMDENTNPPSISQSWYYFNAWRTYKFTVTFHDGNLDGNDFSITK